MRSFLFLSLVVMTGCGDNVVEGDETPSDNHGYGEGIDTSDEAIAKLLPQVCSSRQWTTAFVEDKDLQLRAVSVAHGTALLGVPRGGGSLYGFVVDARGQIIGDPRGTQVLAGNFTGLSAMRQDDRLVAAVVEGDKVAVQILKDDLSDTHFLESMGNANLVADTTMIKSHGHRVTIAGGRDGIVTTQFDMSWAPMTTDLFARDVPTSMSSTAYGDEAMVAWSTDHTCSIGRISANHVATRDSACANSRIAGNANTKSAQLVYEADDGVRMTDIMVGAPKEIAHDSMLGPQGHSPRIVFDGQRYWVSFINAHGDITLGYLAEDGHLVSMALATIRPMDQAYDMAVIDGSVWLYALDGIHGYTGTKMCLVREGA